MDKETMLEIAKTVDLLANFVNADKGILSISMYQATGEVTILLDDDCYKNMLAEFGAEESIEKIDDIYGHNYRHSFTVQNAVMTTYTKEG